MDLHTEKGIVETTYRDIASRAGVAPGTIYFHFPQPSDIVEACGRMTMELASPPTEEIFRGISERDERVQTFCRELFAFYERCPQLLRVRPERDEVPALEAQLAQLERLIDDLARRALLPSRSRRARSLMVALTDCSVWSSLRRDGMNTRLAGALVAGTLLAWLEKEEKRGRNQ